jgi:peptidoglycan/LPS O-acetylase OafA/YrhL
MQSQKAARTARDNRFAYIDALRGYAILAVIAVHSAAGVPDLEWPLRLITNQGARGVQLFFVVSALTLTLSWHQRGDGLWPFLVRRLFRIGPMFYLAMVFVLATEVSGLMITGYPPPTISWFTVLTTATFTHGFHPLTISSIVPGGWSIADEMTFYVLLPLLVATLGSWRTTAWVLIAALGLSLLTALAAHYDWLFPQLDRELPVRFAVLSFPNQFPAFLGGMLVFHLLRTFVQPAEPKVLATGLALAFAAMLAIPFAAQALELYLPATSYLMPIAYTPPFVLLAWCFAKGGGGFLVNGAIEYIGKVSYSAYFWHFPIIGALCSSGAFPLHAPVPPWLDFLALCAAAVALTILGSSITYRLIEQPMIELGRRLARLASTREIAARSAGSVEATI